MEIKYVYIKKFKWRDVLEAELHGGHFWEGRVYRCLHNQKAGSYLISYDKDNCILTDRLITTEEAGANFVCDIEVLTRDSIMNFSVEEDDLDKIIEWEKNGHEDLLSVNLEGFMKAEASNPHNAEVNSFKEVLEKIDDVREKDSKIIRAASEKFLHLLHLNTIQFNVVLDLVDYLIDSNVHGENDLTGPLTISKGGMALNIGKALEYIQVYSGNNRRTNRDYRDLLAANAALIKEQERQIINEEV
jgi:hypothetical protein